MYLAIGLLVVLVCNYIVYRVSFYMGIKVSVDFLILELQNKGYTVEFYEDHIIVTPKYSIEWYKQRRSKILGVKNDNEHEHKD